jgi:hypothetical protein
MAAGGIAALVSRVRAKDHRLEIRPDEKRIDQAGVESFPASDPPSWTLGDDRSS